MSYDYNNNTMHTPSQSSQPSHSDSKATYFTWLFALVCNAAATYFAFFYEPSVDNLTLYAFAQIFRIVASVALYALSVGLTLLVLPDDFLEE